MMKKFQSLILALGLVMPLSAWAQGSGSTAPMPPRMGTMDMPSPDTNAFAVTRSVTGKVAEINTEKHYIVIEDKKGKRLKFKLDEKVKLRADKKTEFAGRKDIKLSDFEPGQFVKVTYLASNETITELRMRRSL